MKEKLTSKQKKFALEFLISGNITDAAKKAGYSERPARQIGSLNLTKPNVVEYMNEILEKTKSEEVATTEEVLEFLTSVMRGDIAEQFGLDPAITDRTKAAQLLMKRFNDNQRMDLELTKLEMIVTAFDRFAVASNVIPIAIALAVAAIVLIITHWDQLKAAMSKLMDWIKGVFSVDWNAQLGVLGEGIEVLLSTVKGIFNSIKQICSGFITFLKGAFTGNIDMALKGVLGILRGVANLVFSIFKTPVNEVIALFNAMGQTIVKAINNLIDGLNHIKVPDWVPGIGGKGINLSHANFRRVPYLAQGAVIPAGNPFLAVLGDQTRGNNLEMPENLLRKIVSEESGKGTGMIKLVVNLDSRTVLERLINTAKEMQMSNGQNVFELGR